MIIMDISQVMIATLMVQLGNHTNAELDENLLRHMILNSIRANKIKFGSDYGELVIAADARTTWRREMFPYYKANRKKNRDASELNWTMIFESLHKIREELKANFPYRVIQFDGAEADDIIAVLVKKFSPSPILILSGDKDFQHLQQYMGVKQYSPPMKKWITCKNPELFLKEHIIRGDVGDGIPNFLSGDDVLATTGLRQKPISSKKMEVWLKQEPEEFCNHNMLRNYKRNQQLVDFDFIPENIQKSILDEYDNQSGKNRMKLFNYFVENNLKNLMDAIGDF